jgi:hypothetical protein
MIVCVESGKQLHDSFDAPVRIRFNYFVEVELGRKVKGIMKESESMRERETSDDPDHRIRLADMPMIGKRINTAIGV